MKEGRGDETCRMPAGRVKGEASPAARPLTRPDGEAAAGEGSGRAEDDGDPRGCVALQSDEAEGARQ